MLVLIGFLFVSCSGYFASAGNRQKTNQSKLWRVHIFHVESPHDLIIIVDPYQMFRSVGVFLYYYIQVMIQAWGVKWLLLIIYWPNLIVSVCFEHTPVKPCAGCLVCPRQWSSIFVGGKLWERLVVKKISLGLLVNVLPFKLCFVDQSILEDMFKGDISWKTLLSLLLWNKRIWFTI